VTNPAAASIPGSRRGSVIVDQIRALASTCGSPIPFLLPLRFPLRFPFTFPFAFPFAFAFAFAFTFPFRFPFTFPFPFPSMPGRTTPMLPKYSSNQLEARGAAGSDGSVERSGVKAAAPAATTAAAAAAAATDGDCVGACVCDPPPATTVAPLAIADSSDAGGARVCHVDGAWPAAMGVMGGWEEDGGGGVGLLPAGTAGTLAGTKDGGTTPDPDPGAVAACMWPTGPRWRRCAPR